MASSLVRSSILLVILAACSSTEKEPHKDGPDLGSSGAGGSISDAGSGGTGTGGASGGAAGSAGSSGMSTDFDGGPACPAKGITTTWGTPRPMISWTFIAASADAGTPTEAGASIDAGANDAASRSGCVRSGTSGASSPLDSRHCTGVAHVEGADAALRLRFDDGTVLAWDASRTVVHVGAPNVHVGDAVWVDYVHDVQVVCPFCGSFYDDSLQIREGDRLGRLLFVGLEGHQLSAPDSSLLSELFGAAGLERRVCRHVEREACEDKVSEVYELAIETTPEQVVHVGELAHVAAGSGTFDVLWAHTSTSSTRRPDACPPPMQGLDGPGPAWDRGFAVSRTR